MQQICKICAKNMQKICHYIDFKIAICKLYAKNLQKICSICIKYAINMQNMHRSMYLHILHIYMHSPTLLMERKYSFCCPNRVFSSPKLTAKHNLAGQNPSHHEVIQKYGNKRVFLSTTSAFGTKSAALKDCESLEYLEIILDEISTVRKFHMNSCETVTPLLCPKIKIP